MTINKTTMTLAMLVLLAISASGASAQTLIVDEPRADREVVDVSGTAGTEERVGFDDALAYEIAWSEDYDDPCWLRLRGVAMSGGETSTKRDLFTHCKYKSSSAKTVGYGYASDDAYRVIQKLKVCTNKKKTKIKGIKIWAARVDLSTGAIETDGSTPKTVERNHCDDWKHSVSTCDANEVATALIVHKSQYGDISGIALECSKIRVSKPMTRPEQ